MSRFKVKTRNKLRLISTLKSLCVHINIRQIVLFAGNRRKKYLSSGIYIYYWKIIYPAFYLLRCYNVVKREENKNQWSGTICDTCRFASSFLPIFEIAHTIWQLAIDGERENCETITIQMMYRFCARSSPHSIHFVSMVSCLIYAFRSVWFFFPSFPRISTTIPIILQICFTRHSIQLIPKTFVNLNWNGFFSSFLS